MVRFQAILAPKKKLTHSRSNCHAPPMIFGEIRLLSALTAQVMILNFLKYFCLAMEFIQVFDMLKVAPR
jgi:hypothetical protein